MGPTWQRLNSMGSTRRGKKEDGKGEERSWAAAQLGCYWPGERRAAWARARPLGRKGQASRPASRGGQPGLRARSRGLSLFFFPFYFKVFLKHFQINLKNILTLLKFTHYKENKCSKNECTNKLLNPMSKFLFNIKIIIIFLYIL